MEAFIDKLIMLEEMTGANVQYRIMSPVTPPFHDYLSIQQVAKSIADFIGLKGYTFVIGVAKQEIDIGGRIELSNEGKDVFIEIDSLMMKFPDSVSATLCHEICHKWLQDKGIRTAIQIENEILTDITAIYLGLGKIMLNGCCDARTKQETKYDSSGAVTETIKVGYLTRDQLALVYCLVCAMRKIPSSDFMLGLNAMATCSVNICISSWSHPFGRDINRVEVSRKIIDDFRSDVTKAQYAIAELDKHVSFVSRSLCETVSSFMKSAHLKLESLCRDADAAVHQKPADPALSFLRDLKTNCEILRFSAQTSSISEEARDFLLHARAIGRHLTRDGHRFPPPSPTMFNLIFCPKDGTRLRLPENSGDLIVTCPTCKYRFAYNTNVISFLEHPAQQEASSAHLAADVDGASAPAVHAVRQHSRACKIDRNDASDGLRAWMRLTVLLSIIAVIFGYPEFHRKFGFPASLLWTGAVVAGVWLTYFIRALAYSLKRGGPGDGA